MSLTIKPFETMQGAMGARAVRETLALMAQGRRNNTGIVTLTPNQTTTVLTDPRIAADSAIHLSPASATAAAAISVTFIAEADRINGSVTITHDSSAEADRTFRYSIDG